MPLAAAVRRIIHSAYVRQDSEGQTVPEVCQFLSSSHHRFSSWQCRYSLSLSLSETMRTAEKDSRCVALLPAYRSSPHCHKQSFRPQ